MAVLPSIRSAVWWAYTISVNGFAIGNLQSFAPSFAKTVDRVREIMFESGPKVVDLVPGLTDISADLERVRLFASNIFQAIGVDVVTIEDFNTPFDIVETLNRPGASAVKVIYSQCLFTSYATQITVGTTFVLERATVYIATVRRAP